MNIASRLKFLREKSGESLQQVANGSGCSKSQVWHLEMGKANNPSINLLKALARHFRVSVSYLVEDPFDAPYDRAIALYNEVFNRLPPKAINFLIDVAVSLQTNGLCQEIENDKNG